jgi:hypothetical protein
MKCSALGTLWSPRWTTLLPTQPPTRACVGWGRSVAVGVGWGQLGGGGRWSGLIVWLVGWLCAVLVAVRCWLVELRSTK